MRFTNTGSCLEMEYRSEGIRLDISTAKQNLTSLKNSTKWMPTKVNIDYSSDGYQIIMTPVSIASFVNFEIKYIHIQNTPCKDCFACLEDRLCIQNEKFCDMIEDCHDKSDEENCALECFHENVYKGFRKQSLFTTAVLEPPVTLILAKKNRAVIQKGHRNGMNAAYQNVK
ncbi:MAM and LDL-receptor class A domain-containing protein 1-like [Magallana gigas]|uniref:MAM and LDL-receptor class A domain-containing protein 1-like n=1 Tax=Magallana gigas TaxID=29159 RepID=UPI003342D0FD